jgi:hypothetical protein
MMMKVLGRKLFFMAAATAMWLAAIQPGVLSAQTSGVGGDGFTRLLWRGTNGSISLWKLDGNLNEMGVHVYGPFPDYDPIAITAAANSYTYVLWRNTDNSISLWGVYPATPALLRRHLAQTPTGTAHCASFGGTPMGRQTSGSWITT